MLATWLSLNPSPQACKAQEKMSHHQLQPDRHRREILYYGVATACSPSHLSFSRTPATRMICWPHAPDKSIYPCAKSSQPSLPTLGGK